jgi:hypothetical protein
MMTSQLFRLAGMLAAVKLVARKVATIRSAGVRSFCSGTQAFCRPMMAR